MTDRPVMSIEDVRNRIDAIVSADDETLVRDAVAIADEFLSMGEAVLVAWLTSKGAEPTSAEVEGFRLLALHRQGAKGDPSFNACRETCRELAWHYNLISAEPGHAESSQRLAMMRLVARHLYLFVSGKLEEAGLGDFCCASRPLRAAGDDTVTPART